MIFLFDTPLVLQPSIWLLPPLPSTDTTQAAYLIPSLLSPLFPPSSAFSSIFGVKNLVFQLPSSRRLVSFCVSSRSNLVLLTMFMMWGSGGTGSVTAPPPFPMPKYSSRMICASCVHRLRCWLCALYGCWWKYTFPSSFIIARLCVEQLSWLNMRVSLYCETSQHTASFAINLETLLTSCCIPLVFWWMCWIWSWCVHVMSVSINMPMLIEAPLFNLIAVVEPPLYNFKCPLFEITAHFLPQWVMPTPVGLTAL